MGSKADEYETMVFQGEGSEDHDIERYYTQQDAEAGHFRMVRKWIENQYTHEEINDS